MQTPHPDPFAHIPISHRHHVGVNYASMMAGKAIWEVVEEAIDEWLRKHSPEKSGEPEFDGYQWKNLFLPNGTVLRTVFQGKNHHCHVEGDKLVYQEKELSPSAFVNAVGGIRRNAWRSVWVLFPDSKHWQLADSLRARKRPVSPRKAAHSARPIRVPPGGGQPVKNGSALFALPLATQYRWLLRPASPCPMPAYAERARSAASRPSDASSMKSSTWSNPMAPP
jgi:hypothetical protein